MPAHARRDYTSAVYIMREPRRERLLQRRHGETQVRETCRGHRQFHQSPQSESLDG